MPPYWKNYSSSCLFLNVRCILASLFSCSKKLTLLYIFFSSTVLTNTYQIYFLPALPLFLKTLPRSYSAVLLFFISFKTSRSRRASRMSMRKKIWLISQLHIVIWKGPKVILKAKMKSFTVIICRFFNFFIFLGEKNLIVFLKTNFFFWK